MLNILFLSISCFIALLGVFWYIYRNNYTFPTPQVNSVKLNDNIVTIKYKLVGKTKRNNIYYMYTKSQNIPKHNDNNWKLATNNECSFELDNNTYYAYLKNENNEIFKVDGVENIGKLTSFEIDKQKIYLPLKGTYTPTLKYEYIGNINTNVSYESEDSSIAEVNENGLITAKKKGNTKVHIKLNGEEKIIDVVSTNLIVNRPKNYDKKKSYLPCGKYNKEENDLLDEILKDRIDTVGYKTRAGAVEAARFLALEFPYKIRYFSENGRGSTNKVDGEGRYYHIGLYLDESRYKNIKKTLAGPKTWGCSLYSRPSKGYRSNGFDCSGFVSWVLLNGGFDVGDIGAGLAPHKDLTDYGKRIKFNAEVVKSGKVKVGDLLSSGGVGGGHIAIIVGEDDKYYYVAESLWTPPNVAVVIIPYSKKNLWNRYYYVMLMDSYYKEDGKLTKMWY